MCKVTQKENMSFYPENQLFGRRMHLIEDLRGINRKVSYLKFISTNLLTSIQNVCDQTRDEHVPNTHNLWALALKSRVRNLYNTIDGLSEDMGQRWMIGETAHLQIFMNVLMYSLNEAEGELRYLRDVVFEINEI